ncbi:MAG TPA: hypothetical protein VF981_08360 [Gemmatimonadaceae bacterium]
MKRVLIFLVRCFPRAFRDQFGNGITEQVATDHDRARTRGTGALNWYRSYPDLSLNAAPQLGLVPALLLRIAGIHDRRGERAEARAVREQFLAMWRNADAELQAIVEQVKEKIGGRSE